MKGNAGIVDQNINSVRSIEQAIDDALDIGDTRQIGHVGGNFTMVLADFIGRFGEPLVIEIHQKQIHVLPRQLDGNGAADARCGASHEGRFSRERFHRLQTLLIANGETDYLHQSANPGTPLETAGVLAVGRHRLSAAFGVPR